LTGQGAWLYWPLSVTNLASRNLFTTREDRRHRLRATDRSQQLPAVFLLPKNSIAIFLPVVHIVFGCNQPCSAIFSHQGLSRLYVKGFAGQRRSRVKIRERRPFCAAGQETRRANLGGQGARSLTCSAPAPPSQVTRGGFARKKVDAARKALLVYTGFRSGRGLSARRKESWPEGVLRKGPSQHGAGGL
jgi:hypothetical protein